MKTDIGYYGHFSFAFLLLVILLPLFDAAVNIRFCLNSDLNIQCGYKSNVPVQSVTWLAGGKVVSTYESRPTTNQTTDLDEKKHKIMRDFSLSVFGAAKPDVYVCAVNNVKNKETTYTWNTKPYSDPELTSKDGCPTDNGSLCIIKIPTVPSSLSCTASNVDHVEDATIVWASSNNQFERHTDSTTSYQARVLVSTVSFANNFTMLKDGHVTCTLTGSSTCSNRSIKFSLTNKPITGIPWQSGRSRSTSISQHGNHACAVVFCMMLLWYF